MRLYATVLRGIVDATIFHYSNLSLFFGIHVEIVRDRGRQDNDKNPE